MKIIIYITESNLDGVQVRFRSSENPHFHLLEMAHLDEINPANDYAEIFKRGAEAGGAETILCMEEGIASHGYPYPIYTNKMMSDCFMNAWTELKELEKQFKAG